MNWLGPISSLIDGVSNYLGRKQEITKAKVEGEVAVIKAEANAKIAVSEAKIHMAKTGQVQDFDLDRLAMQNMNSSYKDEFLLGLFSIPMILAFIPGLADVALRGFEVISAMPQWYQYTFIGMVVVIYGMRGMLTKLLERKSILPGK